MKHRSRIYYTEADKTLMWDRWQKGESLQSIARLFDRHHSSIQGVLARTGGIRPPQRRRSRRTLTLCEREEISRGVFALVIMDITNRKNHNEYGEYRKLNGDNRK